MAYDTTELLSSCDGNGSGKRVFQKLVQPKTFAHGSGTLTKLTPVTFNTSTNKWQVWSHSANSSSNAVETISMAGTVSGGTFTITINDETTGNIAYNANNAAILTALLALGNIDKNDIVISGGPIDVTHPLILSFGGQFAGKAVTVAVTGTSLTGEGAAISVAHTTVGGTTLVTNGTNLVKGFVWPDDIVLVADKEVLGDVLMSGDVHYDDITLPTGELAANLQAALRSGVRELGFNIQGLANFR